MSAAETVPFVPPPFRPWPEGAEIKTYKARCHCGKVTFEFDHPALEASVTTSCNCSFCTRTGGLYMYGPEDSFRLTSDEPAGFLSKKKRSTHRFCSSCGCMLYWTGMGRAGVNIRMIEGMDIESLTIEKFDGARLV